MKQRLIILGILLLGAAGAYWLSRPDPRPAHVMGPLLSGLSMERMRVAGGGNHALAIAPDGSLWSWGDASSALGQGDVAEPVRTPRRVGLENDWKEIYAGYSHSLAIKTDGSLWAWGSNPGGCLGDGTQQPRGGPVRVGLETNWLTAGPGLHHSAGLKRDGTIWAWGGNGNGQLGSPEVGATPTNVSFLPVRVGAESNWTALAVGSLANAALRRDGTLWTWGDGSRTPQVSGAPGANNLTPVQLSADSNWVAVAAGYYHFVALKSDGTLWSWGRNGHLVNGIPAKDPSQPRQFGTETNWAAVLNGAYGNFIQKQGGSWWQVGGMAGRPELAAIPGQWWRLAQGSEFALAVDQDGSLWHWGKILGATQSPNVFKQGLGQLLNAMGWKNSLNRQIVPQRTEPEVIFQLPGGRKAWERD